MGGSGSTRWNWYSKKTVVEECRKLDIRVFKEYLIPGRSGRWVWYWGDEERASIGYRVVGTNSPTHLNLFYTITKWTGEKIKMDYDVILTTTPLAWGGVRYWFICPLTKDGYACGRRVGCLYQPPGGNYFGCRHCYDLTYQSSQEGDQYQSMFKLLAVQMQSEYPGLTWKDTRAMLDREMTPNLSRILAEKYLRDWKDYDPYEDYLTVEQLQVQSGLSEIDLSRLADARLLVPDTQDGRYRPKLAGWGKKLAYLLAEGWEIDEIKRWSNERWKSKNPRKWPPEM